MMDSLDQLHFLRPEWFLAFIPLLSLLWLNGSRRASSRSWQKFCDERLLPYILIGSSARSSRLPMLLTVTALSLCILAASGPVWKKMPQPVFRDQSSLVIAFDLSDSMNASDVSPTRLARAKLKLHDILDSRKEGQTALIVFAATAFTVIPLTSDTENIAAMISSLETSMMPAQGSRASSAIKLAVDLLRQAGATDGDVLLITDEINNNDHFAISELIRNGHRLSILGVGTEDGGPIALDGGFKRDNKGNIIVPRMDIPAMQSAALIGHGLFVNIQLTDRDIELLSSLFEDRRQKTESIDTELKADIWYEEGPWLLLLALPLVALIARRGILVILTAILLPIPEPVHAFDLGELWLNDDQRGKALFEQGEHARAAETFDDPAWRGSASYESGDYDKALEAFSQVEDGLSPADLHYNTGNTLAKMGNYQDAINAYNRALEIDAYHEDAAYNRGVVEKFLQQQPQDGDGDNEDRQEQGAQEQQPESSKQQSSNDDNQNDQSGDQQGDQQQDQQSEGERSDEENDAASSSEGEQQQGEQQQDNEATAEQQQGDDAKGEGTDSEQKNENERSDQQLAEAERESEQDDIQQQMTERWLRRIEDDPGGLLRRKFHYQYRNMPDQQPSDRPW